MEELLKQYLSSKMIKLKANYNKMALILKINLKKYWKIFKTLITLLQINKTNLKLCKN